MNFQTILHGQTVTRSCWNTRRAERPYDTTEAGEIKVPAADASAVPH
jgi:hypothetical protein